MHPNPPQSDVVTFSFERSHSNLNGENRLWRGSINVRKRRWQGGVSLVAHQEQKSGSSPPFNSSPPVPSHFPQCGDLGQLLSFSGPWVPHLGASIRCCRRTSSRTWEKLPEAGLTTCLYPEPRSFDSVAWGRELTLFSSQWVLQKFSLFISS